MNYEPLLYHQNGKFHADLIHLAQFQSMGQITTKKSL